MRAIKFRTWAKGKMHGVQRLIWSGLTEEMFAYDDGGSDELLNATNLMQYTGLRDKNGVEIYEGDVVELTLCVERGDDKYYNKETLAVVWDNEYGAWYAGEHQLASYIDDEDWEHWAEVRGNIYENPELLKEETQ